MLLWEGGKVAIQLIASRVEGHLVDVDDSGQLQHVRTTTLDNYFIMHVGFSYRR